MQSINTWAFWVMAIQVHDEPIDVNVKHENKQRRCVSVLTQQLGVLGHRVSVAVKYTRCNHIGYNFNIFVKYQTITQNA